MRGKLWMVIAAMLLTMVSCTRDMDLLPDEQQPSPSRLLNADTIYIPLRIVAPYAPPATARTRAVEHGDPGEYAVKSGYILLFKGGASTPFDDLELLKAFDMTDASNFKNAGYDLTKLFTADPSSQITQAGFVIIQQTTGDLGIGDTDKLYAVVLLNTKGIQLNSSDMPTAFAVGTKYSYFKTWTIDNFQSSDDCFFMSNAPMSKKEGGVAGAGDIVPLPEVTTLVTQTNAALQDATTVFVERAAAKVTFTLPANTPTAYTVNGNAANKAQVASVEWVIDNYNTASRVVRNFNAASWPSLTNSSSKYPMLDETAIYPKFGGTEVFYRTLWGEDANYSGLPETYDVTSFPGTPYASGQSVYIAENTCSDNTAANNTRIVFRVTLKDASKILLTSPLYVYDGVIYTSAAKLKAVAGKTPSDTGVTTFNTDKDLKGCPYFYYETFIQHFGTDAPTSDLGQRGVLRNHHYFIKPNSLSGVGKNSFPSP